VNQRRVRVVVIGDVQGVGFRWFTRECAQKHAIGGWVRNMPNGSVELTAGGADTNVQAFVDEIRRGPAHAHVTELQIRDERSDVEMPFPFEIRR
jgi:acylphosphatase